MKHQAYQHVIQSASFGYSYHQAVMDSSGVLIDFKTRDCNPYFEQMTGLSSQQIYECDAGHLFSDKKEMVLQAVSGVLQGEGKESESITSHWHGGLYQFKIHPLENGFFYIIYRPKNASEYPESRDALEFKRFQRLAENSPAVVFQFKMMPDESFSFPYISASSKKILGIGSQDIMNDSHRLLGLIHPEDFVRYQYLVLNSARMLTGYHSTFRFRKNNQYIWLEAQSTPEQLDDGSVLWNGFFLVVTDRVDTEQALKKSEEMYRSLVENLNEIVYILDLNAEITYVSPNIQAISGYSPLEMKGKRFIDLVHPDDRAGRLAQFQKILSGVKEATEYRFLTKDGRVVWMRTSAKTIYEKGKPVGVQGVLTDISERKKAEQALEASTSLLNGIYHSIDDGISVFTPDFTIKSVNHAMERWFAHNKPLVGKKCYEAYHGRTEPCDVCPSVRSLSEKKRHSEVVPFIKEQEENGWLEVFTYPLMDSSGNVSGIIEFVRDVSERIQTERALRASERKFRTLFENLMAGFVLHTAIYDDKGDTVNYRFDEVNPAYEKIIGVKAEDIVGKTTTEVFPSADTDWKRRFDQVVMTGEPMSFQCYSNWLDKHLDMWVFRPEENQVAAVFLDITDRKKAEQTIQDNLNEKNVLLSEIHHRVKNNMAVISSLLALQSEFGVEEKSPDVLLQETQNRIKSMALVHEMVYESDNFARINVGELLKRMASNLQDIYGREDRRISLDVSTEDIMLDINNSIPLSLLANELILNAYKHAFKERKEGHITVTLKKEAKGHVLCIEDNGDGVKEIDGLSNPDSFGYTIIQGLVTQLRGSLHLSTPQKGLKAEVVIPDYKK